MNPDEVSQFLDWLLYNTDYIIAERYGELLTPISISNAELVKEYQKDRQ